MASMERTSAVVRTLGAASLILMLALLTGYMLLLVVIREEMPLGFFIFLELIGAVAILLLVKPFLARKAKGNNKQC